ncbi:hypothetical protein FRX31_002284 [Thalictrum thalictroides]|uniref:Uncharacterized protein n=1 Tax=Thalictrum thalictroides TaxID=46969 RepID=A0A7J6XF14_THATH|nr:hypothetical protein FRX31_002284 [Thalictrum thalictroides]
MGGVHWGGGLSHRDRTELVEWELVTRKGRTVPVGGGRYTEGWYGVRSKKGGRENYFPKRGW